MKINRLKFYILRRFNEVSTGLKIYDFKIKKYKKTAVAVCDGLYYSGGLTDRFKSIISLFFYAQQYNVPFRVHFCYPFPLTDYLEPNEYNWIPERNEYVKSNFAARIFHVVADPNHVFRLKLCLKYGLRQLHYYGNRDVVDYTQYSSCIWGKMFCVLFKPTMGLQNKLDDLKRQIGPSYYSVVFRFQNLLGDFQEYDFNEIDAFQQQKLMDDCRNALHKIQNNHIGQRCLITSDSNRFINYVQSDENIFTIPGRLVHMGSNDSASYQEYEKSFVDFFMLVDSTEIYNVVIRDMYPSGFPEYAAKVRNIPFMRISS